jgi:hypothetical protein
MTPKDIEAEEELGPLLYEAYGFWSATYAGCPLTAAFKGFVGGFANILVNHILDEATREEAEEGSTQVLANLQAEVEHRLRLKYGESEPC